MAEELRSIVRLKMKYLGEFWSYVNIGIIVCSWTCVGVYVWRFSEAKRIGNMFKETHGYAYVNLQWSVYVNDLYEYMVGFCCFFATIRLVRVCRYDHRILLFVETIRHSAKDLLSFSLMFSIVFASFMCLFYLLFSSKLFVCGSLLRTAEMLSEMTLMQFDAHDLADASSFLGPFSFSLFIFVVVFVCMSMFITIINDSFRYVHDHLRNDSDDEENIIIYTVNTFLHWTGM